MSEAEKLSIDDISRLIEDPSANTRAEIANKLAKQYQAQKFSPEQLKLAEQIFRLLMRDAETHVRKALAENLKDVKNLPRDVVLQLARDVEEISLPVLQFSEVLNDEDLISIISSTVEVSKQATIAKRENLSSNVSEALVDTKNSVVIENLLNNQTANIDEDSFTKISEVFKGNEEMLDALLNHSAITTDLAERLINRVSFNIREHLENKYKTAAKKLDQVFDRSREVATIKFIGPKTSDEELVRLISYLEENHSIAQDLHNKHSRLAQMIAGLEASGKLTPFTALCMGSLSLFEITMARLAKLSVYNAKKLIGDISDEGLKALYNKAGLPNSVFNAVRVVVNIVRGIQKEPEPEQQKLKKPDYLATYLIQKLLSLPEDQEIENLNYFLSMISLHAKK